MIPSSISLLVLLVVTARVNGLDGLDLSACWPSPTDAPMVCYFPGSCLPQSRRYDGSNVQLVHSSMFNTPSERGGLRSCFAYVAFKKFTGRKFLVTMAFASISKKRGIAISVDAKRYGCKSDDGSTVEIESGLLQLGEIYKSVVRRDLLLCKFTVTGNMEKALDRKSLHITLVLQADSKHEYNTEANLVWKRIDNSYACNPDTLKYHSSPTEKGETSIRPLVEFDKMKCEEGATLYAIRDGKRRPATVVCQHNSYKITAAGGNLNLQSPIACSAKTCSRCDAIKDVLRGSSAGQMPKWSNANDCSELTCPGDRIEIAGVNATIAKPYCKEMTSGGAGTGDFRWTIRHAGEERSFTEASCKDSVRCNDVQPLRVVREGPASGMINPWSTKIACSGDYQLAARPSPTSSWTLIDTITCNPTTGEWKKVSIEREEAKLLPTEEIKCLNGEEASVASGEVEKKAPTTGKNSTAIPAPVSAGTPPGAIIATVLVAIAVILLIAGFTFFAIRKRRKEQPEIGEVDAKPPTPPTSQPPSSDKQSGQEVSFSGRPGKQTPSLKSPQPDPMVLKTKQIPTAKQFEDNVSVTAHPLPASSIGPSEKGPSEKGPSEKGPSDKSTPTPASADASKKKVEALLDQSVPSMSE